MCIYNTYYRAWFFLQKNIGTNILCIINKMSSLSDIQKEQKEQETKIKYKCSECSHIMTYAEIKDNPAIKCTKCAGRILYKMRIKPIQYLAR